MPNRSSRVPSSLALALALLLPGSRGELRFPAIKFDDFSTEVAETAFHQPGLRANSRRERPFVDGVCSRSLPGSPGHARSLTLSLSLSRASVARVVVIVVRTCKELPPYHARSRAPAFRGCQQRRRTFGGMDSNVMEKRNDILCANIGWA